MEADEFDLNLTGVTAHIELIRFADFPFAIVFVVVGSGPLVPDPVQSVLG